MPLLRLSGWLKSSAREQNKKHNTAAAAQLMRRFELEIYSCMYAAALLRQQQQQQKINLYIPPYRISRLCVLAFLLQI
jgi:hypothetical protein